MKENVKKKNTKSRSSNFELLRIIAMIMIAAHHFAVHGGFKMNISSFSFNTAFIQFLQIGGKIGVNIFVLISGYFLINTDNIKLKKIIKLWCQIFIYSFGIYLVFTLFGHHKFNIKDCFSYLFPIIHNKYWFASTYFILYLFVPYINKFVKSIDRITYKKLLILMFVLWSFIPTITKQSVYMNALLWFLFLYLLAGYIRLYFDDTKRTGKQYFIGSMGIFILTYAITIVVDLLCIKWPSFNKYTTYLYGMNRLPILIISVLIFLTFKNIKMKNIKIINIISSATFGVYLIHDNPLTRVFLWKSLFKNATFQYSSFLVPYSIICILLVYVCSTIVELIRINLLEKNLLKGYDRIENKLVNLKNKIFSRIGILKDS